MNLWSLNEAFTMFCQYVLTAVQEDVFKSSRILELCPKSGFEVVVLDPPWKSKNRGLWTSRVVGETLFSSLSFLIFLYFLVVFAWFTIMNYVVCPLWKLFMKIRFIFDHGYSFTPRCWIRRKSRHSCRCALQLLPIPAAFAVANAEAVLRCKI